MTWIKTVSPETDEKVLSMNAAAAGSDGFTLRLAVNRT